MSSRGRVFAGIAVVAVIGVSLFLVRALQPATRNIEVEGTITYVDVENAKATLEYISPRKGKRREMTCDVPSTCKLQIDGRPASLKDFKPGDWAQVTVQLDTKTNAVVPVSVSVDRATQNLLQGRSETAPSDG